MPAPRADLSTDRPAGFPPAPMPGGDGPILRMIDGDGLGTAVELAQAIPPTGGTFCFCTCIPPLASALSERRGVSDRPGHREEHDGWSSAAI